MCFAPTVFFPRKCGICRDVSKQCTAKLNVKFHTEKVAFVSRYFGNKQWKLTIEVFVRVG